MSGKRILLAVVTATAIGVSCTACLSSSVAYDRAIVTTAKDAPTFTIEETTEPIRLSSAKFASTAAKQMLPPPPQAQQNLQFSSKSYISSATNRIEGGSSFRPVGEVSGIDIAVAEFAQSTRQSPLSPLSYQSGWKQEDIQQLDAGYTFVANKSDTGLGLDLAVRPHVSINSQGDVRSTRAGAEVRVGQNLDLRGKNAKNSKWYFFAGADGEAIVWDVQRAGASLTDGQVTLQDKVTVGDVQAGIAFQSPAGQMSISYIQREFEYRNGAISRSGEEEFAAVTLTWRR